MDGVGCCKLGLHIPSSGRRSRWESWRSLVHEGQGHCQPPSHVPTTFPQTHSTRAPEVAASGAAHPLGTSHHCCSSEVTGPRQNPLPWPRSLDKRLYWRAALTCQSSDCSCHPPKEGRNSPGKDLPSTVLSSCRPASCRPSRISKNGKAKPRL